MLHRSVAVDLCKQTKAGEVMWFKTETFRHHALMP